MYIVLTKYTNGMNALVKNILVTVNIYNKMKYFTLKSKYIIRWGFLTLCQYSSRAPCYRSAVECRVDCCGIGAIFRTLEFERSPMCGIFVLFLLLRSGPSRENY